MVPRTEVATRSSPVEVEEGMHNIMMVIEEHVMPMMMDSVVRVAAETNEATVIDGMFSQIEEQTRNLHFCFGSKLYPGAVSMAPKFPAITYGSGSVSRGATAEGIHGSCSRANTAGCALVMEPDASPGHAGGCTSDGADEGPSSFKQSDGDVQTAHTMASASVGAPIRVLPTDVHGSMQTLVPYGESDEEVALPDDDIAFCLRSMFASPG